ncbi:MAG: hypothetical protein DSY77_09065 [Bacteroidetes bacterium]|nr:MAG: hypothetical protein DSY77_09065 [Bacteroidota bacterium]
MNFEGLVEKRKKVYTILLSLLIAGLPLGFTFSTIMLYFLIFIFLLDSKTNLQNKLKAIAKSHVILFYALMYLVQFVSILYSNDKTESWVKIILWIPFLFLPAIILSEGKSHNIRELYRYLKIGITLVLTLSFLSYCCSADYDGFQRYTQIWLVDKMGISQFYIIFLAILPLFLAIKDLEKDSIITNLFVIVISLFFIVFANNFSGLIMTMVVITPLIKTKTKLFPPKYGYALVMFLISIIVVTVAVNDKLKTKLISIDRTSFNFSELATMNKYAYTRNTIEHRIYTHYLILKDIKSTMPFGVGVGDTQHYLNELYLENKFLSGIKLKLNPHDQYMQEYLKTGIIGPIVFILLLFLILRITYRRKSIFFYYVIGFAVLCFAESYLNRFHGVIIFTGILPILLLEEKQKI